MIVLEYESVLFIIHNTCFPLLKCSQSPDKNPILKKKKTLSKPIINFGNAVGLRDGFKKKKKKLMEFSIKGEHWCKTIIRGVQDWAKT